MVSIFTGEDQCKAKMHQQAKLSLKLGSSGYLDYWA
jgi:hypothetical protein